MNVDLRVVRTEDLTIEQRRAIIDLCIRAHETHLFEDLFSHIPSGGRHVLALDGHEIVAHAVATTRWLQLEGQPAMKTAFVDAVSTSPELQGRGIGSATMERLASDVVDHDIGCLQTSVDRFGFYGRVGWELWRGALAGRGEHGLVPTPDQEGVMVLRLPHTPELDLDALLTIECQPQRIWE